MAEPTLVGANDLLGEYLRICVLCPTRRRLPVLAGEFSTCGEWQAGRIHGGSRQRSFNDGGGGRGGRELDESDVTDWRSLDPGQNDRP